MQTKYNRNEHGLRIINIAEVQLCLYNLENNCNST